MDALRFRRRPLFRQQAVDAFVGVFGTGATPDLLRPPPGRGLRLAIIVVIAAWAIWLGAAILLVPGQRPPSPSGSVEEAGPHD